MLGVRVCMVSLADNTRSSLQRQLMREERSLCRALVRGCGDATAESRAVEVRHSTPDIARGDTGANHRPSRFLAHLCRTPWPRRTAGTSPRSFARCCNAQ